MQQDFERLVDLLIEGGFFLQEAVEILEQKLIARALERTGGNCSAASKQLGIHRNTLQKKMTAFKLERKPSQKAKAIRRRSSAAS
jgi:DNA-binding NtrC family response regulator